MGQPSLKSMTREHFSRSRHHRMMERVYRRQLPHWRNDGATYFITWRLARGQDELDSRERDLVASAICTFDGER